MKFSTLERNARAAIKTRPEFRQLERKKTSVATRLVSGEISRPHAKELRKLICLRHRRLVNRELFGLLRADATA
jgi:hypothetical protein